MTHRQPSVGRDSRTLSASTALALAALLGLGACGSQVQDAAKDLAKEQGATLAKAAFIRAANLRCASFKANVAFAKSVGEAVGADDLAKAKAEEIRTRTEDLRNQITAIEGPAGLRDDVGKLLDEAADIPAQVSDGKLTPEEGKARLEELKQRMREEGLDQCVG